LSPHFKEFQPKKEVNKKDQQVKASKTFARIAIFRENRKTNSKQQKQHSNIQNQ